jgi:hypothetical protein
MDVVESFATDKRWRIDTLIALLGIAGDQAADAIPCATIIYIGQCEEYQVLLAHTNMILFIADFNPSVNISSAVPVRSYSSAHSAHYLMR